MTLYDSDFELPAETTPKVVRETVLQVWPEATFFAEEGTEKLGALLIAYHTPAAETSWDKDGRTDENAHDAIMFLWPLETEEVWATCDTEDHEVLVALRTGKDKVGGTPPTAPHPWPTTPATSPIKVTTIIKDASGHVVSRNVVVEDV